MNYEETLNYIHSIPKFTRPLGNANLKRLLALLQSPQDKLKFVHIAGTNGKGSTAAMTAQILTAAGYKTGLYTSPFIEIFNERIQINGEIISDDPLIEYTERVKNIMEGSEAFVSEFAFVTAVALLYFREMKCDIVVLEAGMGGRLDATNVIDTNEVCAICKIALDHTQYLGNTLEEIAREKAGIIKKGSHVILYPNEDNILSVIEKYAMEQNARYRVVNENDAAMYHLSLKGGYQKYNAAVALGIIKALREKGYNIPNTAVKKGLENTVWPARFEFVTDRIIIDGAHNIDGIKALKHSLMSLNKSVTMLIAMMEDKAYKECIAEISSIARHVVATQLNMPRCLSAGRIKEIIPSAAIVKDTKEALTVALNTDSDIVCVTGSLYLAGEIKRILKQEEKS